MTNNYVYSIPQDVLKLSSNARIQIGFQECFGIITHDLYFMATIPEPSSNHPNLFRKTGRSQDFQRRLCAVWGVQKTVKKIQCESGFKYEEHITIFITKTLLADLVYFCKEKKLKTKFKLRYGIRFVFRVFRFNESRLIEYIY